MSSFCHERNRKMFVLLCYFGIYFPWWLVTQEINTKITFLWVHKLLITPVHTLPSILLGFPPKKNSGFMEIFMFRFFSVMDIIQMIHLRHLEWQLYISPMPTARIKCPTSQNRDDFTEVDDTYLKGKENSSKIQQIIILSCHILKFKIKYSILSQITVTKRQSCEWVQIMI